MQARELRERLDAAVNWALAGLARLEPLYGLAGPIFEKELRVSGRRRRNYFLRCGYLAVLSTFVGFLWLTMLTMPSLYGESGPAAYRMASAGKALNGTIVWFQFLALQAVAIVMLSTSISDEVYHRTLGVLLTTPINSLQIVMGKYLGKMIQLGLLLAVSVPLLIVVRVLGGVSAEFVLAGTCITASAAAVAGALSMFFSVGSRSFLLIMLKAVAAMLVLFLLVPMVWHYRVTVTGSAPPSPEAVAMINPYVALGLVTGELISPLLAKGFTFQWWWHCLGMLGFAALVLAVCVVRVRRAALRQLIGDQGGRRWFRRGASTRLRRVRGSPVAWKEARTRIFTGRLRGVLGMLAILGVLGLTYAMFGYAEFSTPSVHVGYTLVLLTFGAVGSAVIAATGITSEKEAGTWPILLVTPLADRAIVLGKAVGAMRRTLPAWAPLGCHLVVFTALGRIHPVAIPLVAVIVFGLTALVTGTGLLFGVLFRRTAAAAVANLITAGFFWFYLPFVAAIGISMVAVLMEQYVRPYGQVAEALLFAHPWVQAGVIVDGASGKVHAAQGLLALRFDGPWPSAWRDYMGVWAVAVPVVLAAGLQLGLGWLMAKWATLQVRRSAF